MYLNLRIGRDFNISHKVGIEIDVGAIFQLSKDGIRNDLSSVSNLDWDTAVPVLYSIGIGVFYRI